MIQNPWSINDLPSQILVIEMAHEERLGGERIGLDFDVCTGDFVDEGGFADVGVAADDECSGAGIYGGETGEMLADLFEVGEGVFLSAHDSGHSGKWNIRRFYLVNEEEETTNRPRAARLSCLHRYKLSPNLRRRQ